VLGGGDRQHGLAGRQWRMQRGRSLGIGAHRGAAAVRRNVVVKAFAALVPACTRRRQSRGRARRRTRVGGVAPPAGDGEEAGPASVGCWWRREGHMRRRGRRVEVLHARLGCRRGRDGVGHGRGDSNDIDRLGGMVTAGKSWPLPARGRWRARHVTKNGSYGMEKMTACRAVAPSGKVAPA